MTFDFGIVNYNGGEALRECIASILALEGAPVRVLVFDNASGDGSPDEAENRFPEITVLRSERNLGYAGALNRMLAAMSGEVAVLCNMDLRFDPGWLPAVAAALGQDPAAAGVASLVLEMTDPPVVNSAGVRFYPDMHPQNVGSGSPFRAGTYAPAEVPAGYGAVMCFRRAAIRELLFEEDYFLFFEETDFFLRLALLGRRILFVPGAIVRHHRSLTTRRYSPLKLYYGERNRVSTVFKLLPVWYWPVAFGYSVRRFAKLRGQVPAGVQAGSGAAPGAATITWTILRAWSGAVRRLPTTLRKRKAFWRTTPRNPRDALSLLRAHRLPESELSVR